MAKLAILFVRFYQYCISPFLGNHCRFYPSCSSYTLTAIERFGLLKGGYIGLRRLLRCHPWSEGGIDHVPHEHCDHQQKHLHEHSQFSSEKTNPESEQLA